MRIDMGNPYNKHPPSRYVGRAAERGRAVDRCDCEMDAACVVVNLFMLPDEPDLFRQCVQNIARVRADCEKYGMPLMIEPLVMQPVTERGGYMVDGDAEKIVTLTRLAREMGADIIKADPTTECQGFPPRGRGGALPGPRAWRRQGGSCAVFDKSAALMRQGAMGMVYGRNIYQHANPSAVVRGLMAIIHDAARGSLRAVSAGFEAL
jgi:class I fructose-bisphosphate aldolase